MFLKNVKNMTLIVNMTLIALSTVSLIWTALLQESDKEKNQNPDGPSVTTDDLSAEHSCRPGSSSYENPVT